jgi:hypothetical protein
MMTYFRQELNRKIAIKEGGRVRKVTSREAIAMTEIKLTLKGDPKFIPVMMAVDREVTRSSSARYAELSQRTRRPRRRWRLSGGPSAVKTAKKSSTAIEAAKRSKGY